MAHLFKNIIILFSFTIDLLFTFDGALEGDVVSRNMALFTGY